MKIRMYNNAKTRRKALQDELGVALENIGSFSVDEEVAGLRNCENMIGVAQVPMGVAGPLRFTNVRSGQTQERYIPLATTEGALVASINRGCKAITESGGAMTHSHRVGATRGPVFKVQNMAESIKLHGFIESHFPDIQSIAEATSRHLTLKKVTSRGVGRLQYVRFVYDTQDAMGMNMATIATDAAVRYIEAHTSARCLALSGNYCVDKKPSWQNFVYNRGTKVWAEVVVPRHVLEKTLKTNARRVYETWLSKCMIGSAMSGSIGFNAQYVNVIAALFLATGQDPAHVVEGSMGMTTAEVTDNDALYVGVYLPDVMVGTVGGGTKLATQKEALSILGVQTSLEFAEAAGAAVLAGEISLLSSLSDGSLAKAHQSLARGKQ